MRVEGKARRLMPWGDSPCLKDGGIKLNPKERFRSSCFDIVTVQIVNIQKGGQIKCFRFRIISG